MLKAISPIDGRYADKTRVAADYFSEYALIKYRVYVEIEYIVALCKVDNPHIPKIDDTIELLLKTIVNDFDETGANAIKDIEKTTNHDVKAVEYYIKDQLDSLGLSHLKEWIHFGLTSQDINNTSMPLMLRDGIAETTYPVLMELVDLIKSKAQAYANIPMLAHTHGQAASPTTMGKELMVFHDRLLAQIDHLKSLPVKAKFGGATGNLNAHKVALPGTNWLQFADNFVRDLGMERLQFTTQIDHYDDMAAVFHCMCRINTILTDLARDMWTYISMDYFTQKVIAGEVGSSAMPHKVNPIDFENAEGNFGMANAVFEFLARKLPISRLQRDLTDSTVTRNIGVPVSHMYIAMQSLLKGLNKVDINQSKIDADLEKQWAVVAEAIQNILRREGVEKPYELLKNLTRGNQMLTKSVLHDFIDTLAVNNGVKAEMKVITPHNYIGYVLSDYAQDSFL
jgi:adenylosuccinate lyase